MKKILLLASLLASTYSLIAQERDSLTKAATQSLSTYQGDTLPHLWRVGGIFNLNGAQTSLSNWAAGGDKYALSINAFINGHAYYKKGKHSWDNNLDLNFGYIKTTSLGSRKNDDRINLTSRYGYAVAKNLDFSFLFNFRTQALKGYTYDSDNNKSLTSNFLAPAYVTVAPGLTWKPVKDLNIFISPVTARGIIVNDKYLNEQGLYGVDTGKSFKFQFGALLNVDYTKQITSNLTYTGSLQLFSNYLHKPQNIYVYNTNLFAVKISKFISATYNINFIYDDNARLFGPTGKGARLQVQSIVGVGLLFNLSNYGLKLK